MQQLTLQIKGMVCERCISFVEEAMKDLGIGVAKAELGQVTLVMNGETQEPLIEERLSALGFGLIQNPNLALIQKVKAVVAELYSGDFDFPNGFKLSAFIIQQLATTQDDINAAFKTVEQTTLEKYVIDYRINKIKELLVYTNQTLADISFALGFSSVSHLSKQFKIHTGLNASHFKAIKSNKEATAAGS